MKRTALGALVATACVGIGSIAAGAATLKLHPKPGFTLRTAARSAGANTSTALGPRITGFVACASVSKQGVCMNRFSLGIPHTAKAFQLVAGFAGLQKGGTLQMNLLDTTGQPITDPLVWRQICCPQGQAWTGPFAGPFSSQTLKITFAYNGKPLKESFVLRIV